MALAKRLALVASVFALALPGSASASFHLNTVNEVFPSSAGSQQYVELKDPIAEPFPDFIGPYYLALYNGAGGFVAKQTLNPDDGFRNSTAPFLVAASAPRDAALGFTLPAGAGQLCFYRSDPQAGGQRVNCLGYGNISMPLGETSPNPPAGESLQRLACGDVGVAAPTRDTDNAACPSGGAGGGGGGGVGDTTSPGVKLKLKKRQDVDKLAVVVRSDEDARVTVQASVAVPAAAARTIRFKAVKKPLRAGVRKKLRLRLRRTSKRAVKRALAHGRRMRAKLKITVKDAAGNRTVKRARIRLSD